MNIFAINKNPKMYTNKPQMTYNLALFKHINSTRTLTTRSDNHLNQLAASQNKSK